MEALAQVMRESRKKERKTQLFWECLMRLHKLAVVYHELRGDA